MVFLKKTRVHYQKMFHLPRKVDPFQKKVLEDANDKQEDCL
jgi:hypothetical protein